MGHNLAVRRRHRLNEDETPLVYALVAERMRELYEDRRGLEQAEPLFRLLWRMDHNRPGRPSYPEPFTWSILEAYLTNNGPLTEAKDFAPRGALTSGNGDRGKEGGD